jgi:phage tail-like protein
VLTVHEFALFGTDEQWRARPHDDTPEWVTPPVPFPLFHETVYDTTRCAVSLAPHFADRHHRRCDPVPPYLPLIPLAADCSGRVVRVLSTNGTACIEVVRLGADVRWTPDQPVTLHGINGFAACFDNDGTLWIADQSAGVSIVDLNLGRVERRIAVSAVRALVRAGRILALTDKPRRLVEFDSCGGWQRRRLCRPRCICPDAHVRRIAVVGGAVVVLWRSEDGRSWLSDPDGEQVTDAPDATTDLAVLGDQLIVAGPAGAPFAIRQLLDGHWVLVGTLEALGYDGTGIVSLPDGTIGYWPANLTAPLVARPVVTRLAMTGTVRTGLLDSGEFQTRWGRVFIDACMPVGTTVRVAATSSDENLIEPAAPPLSAYQSLYTRPMGSEIPWRGAPESFRTLEAPIVAPPGRYLWITVELTGPGSITPQIRAVRAEFPSHDLLDRLPRVYSKDPVAADFLRRLLAPTAGLLGELDTLSMTRDFLVNAMTAPEETLPWLAGFVGLTMDPRWPVTARRRLIARAAQLFARRGTVGSLEEFAQIALDTDVRIIEHFRLRSRGDAPTRPLGSGWRLGDRIGDMPATPIGAPLPFELGAHSFVVLVWRDLTEVEVDVLTQIMDLHRPAHTLWSMCTLGQGSRVGQDLLGVTTRLGGDAVSPAKLGVAVLGGDSIIGTGHRWATTVPERSVGAAS